MANALSDIPAVPIIGLSPTTSFLIQLSRLQTVLSSAELEILAAGIDDWDQLLERANRHCITPMLHQHVGAGILTMMPSRIAESIRRQAHTTAIRNLQLTRDLVGIVDILASDGIVALAYKGPMLAQLLYGDVSLRQFGDLDLLVDDDDVHRASALMQSNGFLPTRSGALAADTALPAEGQLMFVRESPPCPVELHWRIVQHQLSISMSFADLSVRSTSAEIGGHTIRTIGIDDLVVVLAVHHAKHRWERLQWIAEFAEIIDRRESLQLDLSWVLARASELGVERMVLLGLRLTSDLWGIEPEEVDSDRFMSPEIDALVREVYDALDDRGGRLSDVGDRVGFQRRARDRSRDRIAMRASRLFEPSLEDRAVVRLPRTLFGLYYIIRPVRLVFSRLFRRS